MPKLSVKEIFSPTILLAMALMAVIVMMILPMPAWVLDVGLATRSGAREISRDRRASVVSELRRVRPDLDVDVATLRPKFDAFWGVSMCRCRTGSIG